MPAFRNLIPLDERQRLFRLGNCLVRNDAVAIRFESHEHQQTGSCSLTSRNGVPHVKGFRQRSVVRVNQLGRVAALVRSHP
jgi:hypothetical protein